MPICIVAATTLELKHVLPPAHNHSYHTLITGVGTAATVYHLMNFLQHHKPSLIIQAGIAGSFDERMALGAAVLIQKDRFANLGVMETDQWTDVFDLKLAEPSAAPFSNGWLPNPHEKLLQSLQLPLVTGISISEVTTSTQRILQFMEKYQPVVESMEGAAFHYVCLQQQVPFIQLRTISNYIGERNKSKWQLDRAIHVLGEHLNKLVTQPPLVSTGSGS